MYFNGSKQRLERVFGPWLIANSALLGTLLCWFGAMPFA
jgi:hypothetical protein